MKRLLTGECAKENIFQLVDPTQFSESAFESEVVKAVSCLMPAYSCGVFPGAFLLEGERRLADLALVHKSLSHWFVLEVELAGHSLEHHVLPQVRCFRFGEPDSSCVVSLARAFPELSHENAANLLRYVPRYVAVVGNLPDPTWTAKLNAVDVQYITVSVYLGQNDRKAYELDGWLTARSESLGFAKYSAIDNCLKIPIACGLPAGCIQIVDQFGNLTDWEVHVDSQVLWIQKRFGPALLSHGAYVQILRSIDGRISIRPAVG